MPKVYLPTATWTCTYLECFDQKKQYNLKQRIYSNDQINIANIFLVCSSRYTAKVIQSLMFIDRLREIRRTYCNQCCKKCIRYPFDGLARTNHLSINNKVGLGSTRRADTLIVNTYNITYLVYVSYMSRVNCSRSCSCSVLNDRLIISFAQ